MWIAASTVSIAFAHATALLKAESPALYSFLSSCGFFIPTIVQQKSISNFSICFGLSSQFLSASLPFFTNFLRKLYCMMQWELQPPHWHWGPSDVAVLFYLKQSTHSKLLQASSLPKNGNTQWSHAHAHANAASSEQRAASNEQRATTTLGGEESCDHAASCRSIVVLSEFTQYLPVHKHTFWLHDNANVRYDVIIAQDLLTEWELDICYPDDGSMRMEGQRVKMKQRG